MIHKIIKIEQNQVSDDSVGLSWFDMQKPNLSAVSQHGVTFIMKIKFTHLHEGDILVSEEGHRIKVIKNEDEIYILKFKDHIEFARAAYEIGNRHQPVCIEDYTITILNDISLSDLIMQWQKDDNIEVTRTKGYFRPNGKSHHSH